MNRFGEKLRALRKQNSLTQKQISHKLNVSQAYIVQMEKGQNIPNIAMLLKISDLFGISCDKLIRDELELDG